VKGDTLFNISRRYNLTVDQLKALNGLTSNTIFIGQQLKVR
jgi:LysM repeat protein